MWARSRLWLSSIFRRTRFETEVADELEFHLRARASHWEAQGLEPADALRRARIEFGGVQKYQAEIRDTRRGAWVDGIVRDVRYGIRMLAKHPGFTAMAVLSLAIGIGANTAIFSVVNALLFREVPVDRPDELVNIYHTSPGDEFNLVSYPEITDLEDGTNAVFTGIAASSYVPTEVDSGGGVEAIVAEAVTGDAFSVLGIQPVLGRVIQPEDDLERGAHPVVLLGHGYWQISFGGDPSVVGRSMRVAGRAYTIIGVAPPEYGGALPGLSTAVYAPMSMLDEMMGTPMLDERGMHTMLVKARLQPGVSLAEAETAVAAVAADVAVTRPEGWTPDSSFTLVPTQEVHLHPSLDTVARASAWLLMVVVGLVLLLACTNLASFLVARALDRRREVAMRLALGASRGALVRQMLTETTLLSLLGGGVGLVTALILLNILLTDVQGPLGIQFSLDVSLDWNVLLFAIGLSVLAGFALGLVPALQSTRPNVSGTLKAEGPQGSVRGATRWRHALVVMQVAVSLVLLVGAGLFLRNWQQVLAMDPGFGRDPSAVMSVGVPAGELAQDGGHQYLQRLLDRFRALPEVGAVGFIHNLPLGISNSGIDFAIDGHLPPNGQETFQADQGIVDGDFFQAAGIPILEGRSFTSADGPENPAVVIVSEAMARRFWPEGGALGRVVRRPGAGESDALVVGVAANIDIHNLGEAPRLMTYFPYTQSRAGLVYFVARTSIDAEQTAATLLRTGREVDPDMRVLEVKTMAAHFAEAQISALVPAFLLSGFGILALGLASIGLYGTVSYAVATRTREMGIRMALGADARTIGRLLATGGLRLVVLGCIIGLALSFAVSRLLSGFLVGTEAFDPITFLAAPLVLGATSLLAVYVPARRASSVDPVEALRAD